MDRGNQYKKVCIKLLRGKKDLRELKSDDEFYKEVISVMTYDELLNIVSRGFNNRPKIRDMESDDLNKFIGSIINNQYIKERIILNSYVLEIMEYLYDTGIRLDDLGLNDSELIEFRDTIKLLIHKSFLNFQGRYMGYIWNTDDPSKYSSHKPKMALSQIWKILKLADLYSKLFEAGLDETYYQEVRYYVERWLVMVSPSVQYAVIKYHETYDYKVMEDLLRYIDSTFNEGLVSINLGHLRVVDEHIRMYQSNKG